MFEKVQRLTALLRARTHRKMTQEEQDGSVLFMLMSAFDSHFDDLRKRNGVIKYRRVAELLRSPREGGGTYVEEYGVGNTEAKDYKSGDVSDGMSAAKRGDSDAFIPAILHCMWENLADFPFLKGELTDPSEFDDGEGASIWAALAYADLYGRFVGGQNAVRHAPQTGRTDGLARIADDFQLAQQRIGYSLDTGSGHVSFADLKIDFLPEELDQVDFMSSLDLRNTKIKSLPNLSKFKKLKILNCSYMPIADIKFLKGCDSLETLYIGMSDVDSLDGIEDARNLKNFYCGSTFVRDLSPLGNCQRLEHVSCENTYITSLKGLEKSPDLHTVDCGTTQITSLMPLESSEKLKRLVLSQCHIDDDSEAIWTKQSLKEVTFFNGSLGTVPPEFLSKSPRDNCRDRLREFFKINDKMVDFRVSKVFILGNGGVGKTQLAGLLTDREFSRDSLSTHGVNVSSVSLPNRDLTSSQETLQIWDFGGQELYHGIHAIFLRRRIIYILAWSPRHEEGRSDDLHDGFFQNYPVSYWQSFIRSGGSNSSPLIVVETKIDEVRDTHLGKTQVEIDGFDWARQLHVSSCENRDVHRAALLEAIKEAIRKLSSQGPTKIPLRWLHVIDEIAILRKDIVRGTGLKFSVAAESQRIFIAKEDFYRICWKHGIEEGGDLLLEFMDSIGEVIYRPGFKDDVIIVDQNAAFFAVYQVANRGAFRSILTGNRGRFTVRELAAVMGDSIPNAVQLLDLMLSFGTCFETYRLNGDATYIAPLALLRDPPPIKMIRESWETLQESYEYDFMHDGFFHSLISRIGVKLRAEAEYWADGVYYDDQEHLCSIRLTREKGEGVRGTILVEAQHPKGVSPVSARRYLTDIDAIIQAQEFDSGITPSNSPATRRARNSLQPGTKSIIKDRQPTFETGNSVAGLSRDIMRMMAGLSIAEISAIEKLMGYKPGEKSGERRLINLFIQSLHGHVLGTLHDVVQEVRQRTQ